MADNADPGDLDHIAKYLPLPTSDHLIHELGVVVHHGPMPRRLATLQSSDHILHALLLLSCVRDGVAGGETLLERLCRIVARAAERISAVDLANAATALVGSINVDVGLQTRREEAAFHSGIRTRGVESKDKILAAFDRRKRAPILIAIAQQIIEIEKDHRNRSSVESMVQRKPDVPPQLAIDWLERLADYRGLAEQLDSFIGDIASWELHKWTERGSLSPKQLDYLHHTSLFRLAYFEYRYLRFEHERKSLWVFDDANLEEPMTDHVWQFRLLSRFQEHHLALLATLVATDPIPNVYSFRINLESSGNHDDLLRRWSHQFTLCECAPNDKQSDCPVHEMQRHAEWIIETERHHRRRVMGWYDLPSLPTTSATEERLETLRHVHLDTRGAGGSPSDLEDA